MTKNWIKFGILGVVGLLMGILSPLSIQIQSGEAHQLSEQEQMSQVMIGMSDILIEIGQIVSGIKTSQVEETRESAVGSISPLTEMAISRFLRENKNTLKGDKGDKGLQGLAGELPEGRWQRACADRGGKIELMSDDAIICEEHWGSSVKTIYFWVKD